MAQAPAYNNNRSGYRGQSAPAFETQTEVTLTADGQSVDVRGVTTLYLRSDNTTAANRTFVLTDGDAAGHRLLIIFYAGSSYTAQLADSGNVKLSAAWEPLQYDTLQLYWTGTEWVELGRADN